MFLGGFESNETTDERNTTKNGPFLSSSITGAITTILEPCTGPQNSPSSLSCCPALLSSPSLSVHPHVERKQQLIPLRLPVLWLLAQRELWAPSAPPSAPTNNDSTNEQRSLN